MELMRPWTEEEIEGYFDGIKHSDYPKVFWKEMLPQIQDCTTLMDIGSGPGAFALVAAIQGMMVQAIDVSRRNLEALEKKSQSMSLDNVKTIWGDWLEVEVKRSEVAVAAYCFSGGIGSREGIRKILDNTSHMAYFIAPADNAKTDFLTRELFGKLGKTPPSFSNKATDLLGMFDVLGEKVQGKVLEYDFGMPVKSVEEEDLQALTLYLVKKLDLVLSPKTISATRKHIEDILTLKNGMHWLPNPRRSMMLIWRR